MHSEGYHHKTDARQVRRCESVLEEAISELIARKEREAGARLAPQVGLEPTTLRLTVVVMASVVPSESKISGT
jgi:hypothetical protein